MHRIDGAGATAGELFTEGDPAGGVPATTVTDGWLNAVQEEIAAVIENNEALDKADNGQLLAAIQAIATVAFASVAETFAGALSDKALTPAGFAGNISTAAAGYAKLPGGLILQWLTVNVTSVGTTAPADSVTWPVAFPNAIRDVQVTADQSSDGTGVLGNIAPFFINPTVTGATIGLDTDNETKTWPVHVFTIGY
jgi:hypothetical protein